MTSCPEDCENADNSSVLLFFLWAKLCFFLFRPRAKAYSYYTSKPSSVSVSFSCLVWPSNASSFKSIPLTVKSSILRRQTWPYHENNQIVSRLTSCMTSSQSDTDAFKNCMPILKPWLKIRFIFHGI